MLSLKCRGSVSGVGGGSGFWTLACGALSIWTPSFRCLLHKTHANSLQTTMSDGEDSHCERCTSHKHSVTTETPASSADGAILVEDLLKRCHDLLNELDRFRTFIAESKKEKVIEIRQFQNSVLSELKSLERVRKPTTMVIPRRH